jgi:hypothetical protein
MVPKFPSHRTGLRIAPSGDTPRLRSIFKMQRESEDYVLGEPILKPVRRRFVFAK